MPSWTGSQSSYVYNVGIMQALDELNGLLAIDYDPGKDIREQQRNRLDEARALMKLRMAALCATEEIVEGLDNGHRISGTIWKAFYTMVDQKMENHKKLSEDEKRGSQIHVAAESTIREMVDEIKNALLEKVHSEAKMTQRFQASIDAQKSAKSKNAPHFRGCGGGPRMYGSRAPMPAHGGRSGWGNQSGNARPPEQYPRFGNRMGSNQSYHRNKPSMF